MLKSWESKKYNQPAQGKDLAFNIGNLAMVSLAEKPVVREYYLLQSLHYNKLSVYFVFMSANGKLSVIFATKKTRQFLISQDQNCFYNSSRLQGKNTS